MNTNIVKQFKTKHMLRLADVKEQISTAAVEQEVDLTTQELDAIAAKVVDGTWDLVDVCADVAHNKSKVTLSPPL